MRHVSSCVLDASCILAVLRREDGFQHVLPRLSGGLVSSVNMAEVYCCLRRLGSDPEMDHRAIPRMQLQQVPFDDRQAAFVASIYPRTLGSSLGLADRACIALGLSKGLPVLTGDRAWLGFELDIEIELFRSQESSA